MGWGDICVLEEFGELTENYRISLEKVPNSYIKRGPVLAAAIDTVQFNKLSSICDIVNETLEKFHCFNFQEESFDCKSEIS